MKFSNSKFIFKLNACTFLNTCSGAMSGFSLVRNLSDRR